jgi:hypothetical protein
VDDIVTRLREHQNPHYPLDEAADEIERWRKLADRMYAEIVKDYCWHCGHEMTRNCYTSDLMDEYRNACIDSGVRDA